MPDRLRKIFSNLAFQVLIALIAGIAVGYFYPAFAIKQRFIGTYFISVTEWLAAPVIFLSITTGIAAIASLKKLGRIALKSVILFEVMTTVAIVFGLVMAALLKPGTINKGNLQELFKTQEHLPEHTATAGWQNYLPAQNVLWVLISAMVIGLLLHFLPQKAKYIFKLEKIRDFIFKIITLFFSLTPLAVFSGMAYTISNFGLHSILPMSKLVAVMYLLVIIFVFVFIGLLLRYYKFSIWQLLVLIKEEILIVFGTSSSRTVIPLVIARLENYGCSKPVTGFVLSMGYSFNLIGTSIYLGLCTMFLIQLYHIELDIYAYFKIILILMLVSKGASGVPGAGFIALSSAIYILPEIPSEGLLFIVAVERFLNEARSITNTIGNAACTLVIAKSEHEFTEK
ncbi:aerobic C4-dicarboxylate transport protein [Pedobacter cryoconitis]|uniref:Aerobic C4-dicarboxylate transport protein n=1 Tax=Pedobacter cryoconitis TaxID=188932 RepID=A0A7W8YRI1_9SPHI|nr:cation:dicarboxylase symporter family transporter [Pedobacter cryoconitis]MBB5620476.1 aerobic C4-dicarboxylate transport protein [Pedobacter cryoconitis]